MTWKIFVTLVAAGLAFPCGLPSGDAFANDPQGFSGLAAHYTKGYEGKTTSGEPYDPKKFTAAHRTLPFGTRLRITDPRSHRSVDVTVNDRGPFAKRYVIDLSYAAAQALHMSDQGLLKVTAEVL
jgi:rare lipoprotein A